MKLQEIPNNPCKLCGIRPTKAVADCDFHWQCPACGATGPYEDLTGEKWDRLMSSDPADVQKPLCFYRCSRCESIVQSNVMYHGGGALGDWKAICPGCWGILQSQHADEEDPRPAETQSEDDAEECSYCGGDGPNCGATNSGYCCTREKGHSGSHAACGFSHPAATWPNENSPEPIKDTSQAPQNPWAFPQPKCDKPEVLAIHGCGGMTLRDWFAGQALSRLADASSSYDEIAKWVYELADAMLKQREVKIVEVAE